MKRQVVRFWLLVACAVLTGLFIAREPWRVYREQRAIANNAEAELRKLEADRADLLRKKAAAESSIGREKLAREQNFVRKGEVRIGDTP